ncbi:hypothetical protein WICMUC_001554, partial [Wickerhamomyces mucosus]
KLDDSAPRPQINAILADMVESILPRLKGKEITDEVPHTPEGNDDSFYDENVDTSPVRGGE